MERSVALFIAILWSVLIRLLTSTFPYSGEGHAPMFGDFEAQRHWMEVTTQLPLKEWYVNSTRNDLLYWGMDYPPLTAYHSWLCGKVSEQFNSSWTTLKVSRGHESGPHRRFMRYSVLVSDMVVFYPAVLYFSSLYTKKTEQATAIWALLTIPASILIDHGHFQYNCVCLGLFMLSVAFLKSCHYGLSAVCFSLALNFKQTALYFAVPMFLWHLKACTTPCLSIARFLLVSFAVIATFLVMWLPFGLSGGADLLIQIMHRIFPFHRGIFEDKVANFWCITSVIVKYKNLFSQMSLAKMAFGATVLACLPSWAMLWFQGPDKQRNFMNFHFALFNSAMGFFLFSYHVHEKAILFPLMALALVTNDYPEFAFYTSTVACFSLAPLFAKDGLLLAYGAVLCQAGLIIHKTHLEGLPHRRWNKFYLLRLLMGFSFVVGVLIHVVEATVAPPARFPHLFVLINQAFSFIHFACFYLYGHILQWRYTGDLAKFKSS